MTRLTAGSFFAAVALVCVGAFAACTPAPSTTDDKADVTASLNAYCKEMAACASPPYRFEEDCRADWQNNMLRFLDAAGAVCDAGEVAVAKLLDCLAAEKACNKDIIPPACEDESNAMGMTVGTNSDCGTAMVGGEGEGEGDGGAHVIHYSYEGADGPDHWGTLDPSFATCGTGASQSPIDMAASVTPGTYHGLEVHYGSSALNIINNGHTVQMNYDTGSNITLDGVDYKLAQFHFHAHSEHALDGVTQPLELHLVHESATGALAVLGVLVKEGAENTALADVFAHLPAQEGPVETISGVTLDAAAMLPAHAWTYRYDGSLTTPPCTEGVKWAVFSETIEASAAQIARFTAIYSNNARPPQALGTRVVDGAHFSYEGESGPTHWGEAAPPWGLCESGSRQTPVDVPTTVMPGPYAGLAFAYQPSPLSVLNNGHTIQANYEAGSKITLDSTDYALLQLHLHAHSEHTLAGVSYPLELHLVHKSAAGALAVVGLMIQAGPENAALAPLLANMPAVEGPAASIAATTIDAAGLLPLDRSAFRYDGSLTTPPCSEGVKWIVMARPITASTDQIAAFTTLYADNFRPLQDLGGRTIAGIEDAVSDVDGNTYPVVQATDGHLWMTANLTTTTYADGSPVANLTDAGSWQSTTAGAYVDYENDAANDPTYGKLYNWYAVSDARGLCPLGWHSATQAEWLALINAAGGDTAAGAALKAVTGWSDNTGATNSSGLSVLPAGFADSAQTFSALGSQAYLWTATSTAADMASYLLLAGGLDDVFNYDIGKNSGMSCRCVTN